MIKCQLRIGEMIESVIVDLFEKHKRIMEYADENIARLEAAKGSQKLIQTNDLNDYCVNEYFERSTEFIQQTCMHDREVESEIEALKTITEFDNPHEQIQITKIPKLSKITMRKELNEDFGIGFLVGLHACIHAKEFASIKLYIQSFKRRLRQ